MSCDALRATTKAGGVKRRLAAASVCRLGHACKVPLRGAKPPPRPYRALSPAGHERRLSPHTKTPAPQASRNCRPTTGHLTKGGAMDFRDGEREGCGHRALPLSRTFVRFHVPPGGPEEENPRSRIFVRFRVPPGVPERDPLSRTFVRFRVPPLAAFRVPTPCKGRQAAEENGARRRAQDLQAGATFLRCGRRDATPGKASGFRGRA